MPRKSNAVDPLSPGGRLQGLRKRLGLSLNEAAALYSVTRNLGGDAGHLSRIEQGKVIPSRETLDVLLLMYEATPFEQWEIRMMYEYDESTRLPNEYEIQWAVEKFRKGLVKETMSMPIYLMDYGQRILDWNRIVPRLIGLRPNDPHLEIFRGSTTFDLAFNPILGVTFLIDNPEEFLSQFLQMVWCEFQPYINQDWCKDLDCKVKDLISNHPNKKLHTLWDAAKKYLCTDVGVREIGPIRLAKKEGDGYLQFITSAPDMVLDRRFRIARYIPVDAETLLQCQIWARE